jgi:phosphoserine aminotransferase
MTSNPPFDPAPLEIRLGVVLLELVTLEELRVRRVGVAVLAAETLEELRGRRVPGAARTSFFDAIEELRVLLDDVERVTEAADEADCSSSD